jgi:hypothetical protein
MENKISVEIPVDAENRIEGLISDLNNEMPWLANLKNEERHALPKMGNKSVSFVEKALEFATIHPTVLPGHLDINEFKKDLDLVKKLLNYQFKLNHLMEKIDDTIMLAGSEAYSAALIFYASSKTAARSSMPGLKNVVDELSARFPGKVKVKTEETAQIES